MYSREAGSDGKICTGLTIRTLQMPGSYLTETCRALECKSVPPPPHTYTWYVHMHITLSSTKVTDRQTGQISSSPALFPDSVHSIDAPIVQDELTGNTEQTAPNHCISNPLQISFQNWLHWVIDEVERRPTMGCRVATRSEITEILRFVGFYSSKQDGQTRSI